MSRYPAMLIVVCVCFAGAAGVAGVAGGCQQKPVASPYVVSIDLSPVADYPKIVTTKGLHQWLVFSPPTVQPGNDERSMSISVPVQSKWDQNVLNLQYRITFLDNAGNPVKTNQGPRLMHIEPHVRRYFQATAASAQAADWTLEIRPAR